MRDGGNDHEDKGNDDKKNPDATMATAAPRGNDLD